MWRCIRGALELSARQGSRFLTSARQALRLAANPLIFVPVILVPLFVILLTNLLRTIRLAGKIAKDEEQAAVREAIEELRKKREAAQLPSNQEGQTDGPVNPDARS